VVNRPPGIQLSITARWRQFAATRRVRDVHLRPREHGRIIPLPGYIASTARHSNRIGGIRGHHLQNAGLAVFKVDRTKR
jgi:hypothetical protein